MTGSAESAGSGGPAGEGDAEGSRSVLFSSVRHALVHGESRLFRSYAVVGTLVAAFVALLVLLAFPTWANLTQDAGVLQRVGRAFLVLSGLALLVPVLLPLLLVERRRRSGRPQRQLAFGLAGYAYVASLYLAAVVSAPPGLRDEPGGALAPAVEVLYGLPPVAAGAILLAGAGGVVAVERGVGSSVAAD